MFQKAKRLTNSFVPSGAREMENEKIKKFRVLLLAFGAGRCGTTLLIRVSIARKPM